MAAWNAAGADDLPGYFGMCVATSEPQAVVATLELRRARGLERLPAPRQRAGAGRQPLRPRHLAEAARRGNRLCHHRAQEQLLCRNARGREDATASAEGDGKPIARFPDTQLILWPKP
jgi:hypothetical protein